MDTQVIGVAIAALIFAVGEDDLRAGAANDGHQATDRLVELGLCEALRVEIRRLVRHPRVAIAEQHQLVVADHRDGGLELAHADGADVGADLGGFHRRIQDVALLAPGAGDEYGVHALGVIASDGRRALRGFVVGMRMDAQQTEICHSPDATAVHDLTRCSPRAALWSPITPYASGSSQAALRQARPENWQTSC